MDGHREHAISEEFEEKISKQLGNPRIDPHGDPIPTKDGILSQHRYLPLAETSAGDFVVIKQISDDDPDMLRYMDNLGLLPGIHIKILSKEPFNGPLKLRIENKEFVIGFQVAKCIFIDLL